VTTGVAVVSEETHRFAETANGDHYADICWIVVKKPRLAFLRIVGSFFATEEPLGRIAASAKIHPGAVLDPAVVNIGENVVIEEGVVLGSDVRIDHNTVIRSPSRIGDHVRIGANCTIGGVGFGYELNDEDQYVLVPHIGKVVIEDHVEIGNNTCIDRAVLGETLIGENVKIDNLVHIAHGVKIGRNSLVIANAMIAGSVSIGENAWIAPSVSVIQKTAIGSGAVVGMGSVVLKNVEPDTVVAGVPARKLRDK
jgi:UDP-3-O-[3-hydroxymyristoyl] glucosamine N-acyltransferase